MLGPLKGEVAPQIAWSGLQATDLTFDLLPAGSLGEWWVDEYTATWTDTPRVKSYAAAQAAVDAEFAAWAAGCRRMVGFQSAESLGAAVDFAAYVTWSCVVAPAGHLRRPAMYMSKNAMASIWSWDNCFNALALARHAPALAWDQLMVMLDLQDPSGVVPDLANDRFVSWSFCKPPIYGWALDAAGEGPGAAHTRAAGGDLRAALPGDRVVVPPPRRQRRRHAAVQPRQRVRLGQQHCLPGPPADRLTRPRRLSRHPDGVSGAGGSTAGPRAREPPLAVTQRTAAAADAGPVLAWGPLRGAPDPPRTAGVAGPPDVGVLACLRNRHSDRLRQPSPVYAAAAGQAAAASGNYASGRAAAGAGPFPHRPWAGQRKHVQPILRARRLLARSALGRAHGHARRRSHCRWRNRVRRRPAPPLLCPGGRQGASGELRRHHRRPPPRPRLHLDRQRLPPAGVRTPPNPRHQQGHKVQQDSDRRRPRLPLAAGP